MILLTKKEGIAEIIGIKKKEIDQSIKGTSGIALNEQEDSSQIVTLQLKEKIYVDLLNETDMFILSMVFCVIIFIWSVSIFYLGYYLGYTYVKDLGDTIINDLKIENIKALETLREELLSNLSSEVSLFETSNRTDLIINKKLEGAKINAR